MSISKNINKNKIQQRRRVNKIKQTKRRIKRNTRRRYRRKTMRGGSSVTFGFGSNASMNSALVSTQPAPEAALEENLLNNNESELGDKIYFSAYYVKNTVGGASMETSCEIGLKTADLICNKYTIKNPRKPIYKTRDYISLITLPFIILDCILYKLNLKPITDFIDPVILLVIYFSIIIYFTIIILILLS